MCTAAGVRPIASPNRPNTNYTVPDDNPYENGVGGVCDEIWSSGLRNPWRWSFDSLTGEIYIGDVGQFDEEEVDVQAADGGMEDWGWDCYEGNSAYTGPSAGTGCGPMGDYDFPVFAYTSSSGTNECAITGGFVYRGSLYPAMVGHYIFADYCSGEFWSLYNSGGTWEDTHQGDLGGTVLTFGEGYDGEIYVSLGGSIYHVVEDTLSTTHTPSPTATHTATATQTPSASLTPTPTIIPTPSDFLFLALIRG